VKIADGKHFLDIVIRHGELSAHVICNAQPDKDENAACRMAKGAPICLIKESWASLGPDMLATSHHSIREIHAWTSPLPIIYVGEGSGEDYEDYVIPDIEHPTYPKDVRAAYEAARRDGQTYRTYSIGECVVTVDKGSVTTLLPDGQVVNAIPDPAQREEQVARARALGYVGDDDTVLRAMTEEHDLLHTVIADALGYGASVALTGAATGEWDDARRRLADAEERLTLLIAHIKNVGLPQVLADRVTDG
jgi:hypothetical protein